MVSDFARALAQPSTTEERLAAMAEHLQAQPSLNETDLRLELAKRGLSEVEVDKRIAHARLVRQMAANIEPGSFVWERITRIGYCNADGQEVIGKTSRSGPEGQRVFVMRCRVCGHEYGAYGCDADIRRCPQCQDGLPGLPVNEGP